MVTKRASSDVWSHANIHGDVALTTDAAGVNAQTFTYDPSVNRSVSAPRQTTLTATWTGAGSANTNEDSNTKPASPPSRWAHASTFLHSAGSSKVDPVEGGCANDYVYVFGDPVNSSDLDGRGVRECARLFKRMYDGVFRNKRQHGGEGEHGLLHRHREMKKKMHQGTVITYERPAGFTMPSARS